MKFTASALVALWFAVAAASAEDFYPQEEPETNVSNLRGGGLVDETDIPALDITGAVLEMEHELDLDDYNCDDPECWGDEDDDDEEETEEEEEETLGLLDQFHRLMQKNKNKNVNKNRNNNKNKNNKNKNNKKKPAPPPAPKVVLPACQKFRNKNLCLKSCSVRKTGITTTHLPHEIL